MSKFESIQFMLFCMFRRADKSGLGCAWAVPLRECPPAAPPPPPLLRFVRQPNHSRGLLAIIRPALSRLQRERIVTVAG